ncbi:unnamed protein product [Allacma fusca]|uniref:TEP1-F n=1 Tax=Allacma fusca TaxID=39272 RepID=A0A8J2J5J1_9HEXA|nr:unnamed protein product [Allacma fusca]
MKFLGNYFSPDVKFGFIIFSLVLSAFEINAEFSTIYTALSPPKVFPNSDYNISVFLQPNVNEITVMRFSAELQCGITKFKSKENISIESGKFGKIVIKTKNFEEQNCDLTLTIAENGVVEHSISNVMSGIDEFFFIQTDKPVYKPQDKIQFRVLLLDRHSKPKRGTFHIRIFDSQKNLIRLWHKVSDEIIFRRSLELSYEPNLGEWKIEVTSALASVPKQIATFKVAKYVLPKFDVDIGLPDFQIWTIGSIMVPLRAKYTYGEGVKGSGTMNVTLSYRSCQGDRIRKLVRSATFSINGYNVEEITLDKISDDDKKNGAELQFQVTVTEDVTGRTAKSEKSMTLYKLPYQIRPVEKLSYYRLGLPFLIGFEIIDHSNRIIDADGENVTVQHNFLMDGKQSFVQPIHKGRIELNLTATEVQASLEIEVKYKKLTYTYIVPERLENDYSYHLLIHADSQTISQRESTLRTHIMVTDDVSSVNSMIVSNNEIIASESFKIPDLSSFDIDVTIPRSIASDAKLYVFTFINNQYAGDYLDLIVSESSSASENFLNISIENRTYVPGEEITLTINSRAQSLVAIRGIDESLYLLSASNDISPDALHQKTEKKDLDEDLEGFFELIESGMLIASNGDRLPAGYLRRDSVDPFAEVCSIDTSASGGVAPEVKPEPELRLRSSFPETWLYGSASNITKIQWSRANAVTLVTFEVIPSKFGEIPLEIQANTGHAGDALLTALRVIPAGEKITISQTKILTGIGDSKTYVEFQHKPPSNIRSSSGRSTVTFISDIMSVATENLGNLIDLPVGCGEQNMVNFVADVVILKYLSAANKLTKKIRDQATRFLELGYQRELTFCHDDGSFSAFGKQDLKGSTWLTAYVIRYFLAAKPYITVDAQVINDGLTFLKSRQLGDGQFEELGSVIDSSIKGSVSSKGVALTAFCMLTFIQAKKDGIDVDPGTVDKARSFYMKYLSLNQKDDLYAVTLVTYVEHAWHALHSEKSTQKDYYFDVLKQRAVDFNFRKNKLRHWGGEKGAYEELPETKPINIEMTGYALLAYLERNDSIGALPIVNWLLQYQNSEGGFLSTQDTVVALTALGKYSEMNEIGDIDLDLQINWKNKRTDLTVAKRNIFKNNLNAAVLGEYHYEVAPGFFNITTYGSGSVYVTVSWFYNSNLQSVSHQNDFILKISPMGKTSKEHGLNICTSFEGKGQSNMAILEVNLPSGFIIDTTDLDTSLSTEKTYKRHEVKNKDTKLDIYFDFISHGRETCVEVRVLKVFDVANLVYTFVRVYDYYFPTKKAVLFYDPASYGLSDYQ